MEALELLEQQPYLGRNIEGLAGECPELVIKFGNSGYMAQYRIEPDVIKHQREAGYTS